MKHNSIRMYLVNTRQKLGYTQYLVALKMGVCHQHYNRIESGAIGTAIQFKTLVALSIALIIPLEVICKEEADYQNNIDSGDDEQLDALTAGGLIDVN